MKLLDLTLPSAEENLALDEALLLEAEQGSCSEILRFWEPDEPMVVMGRSSVTAEEVQLEECQRRRIAIGRRASGGATIVTGPGCLMYAVVLSYESYPAARMLDQAHATVLDRLASRLKRLDGRTIRRGTSDLAIGDLKFSGNSLRCRRSHFLYHGTILYDFDLPLISRLLGTAPRQPAYREGRTHDAFVGNFPARADDIRRAIRGAWAIESELGEWPQDQCERLYREKYTTDQWRFSR